MTKRFPIHKVYINWAIDKLVKWRDWDTPLGKICSELLIKHMLLTSRFWRA